MKKSSAVVNMVLNIIIAVLVLAATVFFGIFVFTFFENIGVEDPDLGTGLSAAISLIFMIIICVGEAVVGYIGAIWSGIVRKRTESTQKSVFTACMITDIVFPSIVIIASAVIVIMNNAGVF